MRAIHKLLQSFTLPSIMWDILFLLFSLICMLYILLNNLMFLPLSSVIYSLSAYSLFSFSMNRIEVFKKIKSKVAESSKIQLLRTDSYFRNKLFLHGTFSMNVSYALLNIYNGYHFQDTWFFLLGLFYTVVGLCRLMLLAYLKKGKKNSRKEWILHRRCGVFIFFLMALFNRISYEIIENDPTNGYDEWIIYGVAAYTFYFLIVAVMNVLKYRSIDQPVLSAVKIISLVTALISLFSLQTAMFHTFGSEETLQVTLHYVLSSCISMTMIFYAFKMITHSNKQIKKLTVQKQFKRTI